LGLCLAGVRPGGLEAEAARRSSRPPHLLLRRDVSVVIKVP
jgi:hypothetical protein